MNKERAPKRTRTHGGPRKKKQPAKRGVANRLYLMLLDQEWHEISEFYSFLMEAIDPQMAVRAYLRRGLHNKREPTIPLEDQVREGKENAFKSILWNLLRKGNIEVIKPPKVRRNTHSSTGWLDISKMKVRLTDVGFSHLLGEWNKCAWGRLTADLFLGLKFGKIKVSVTQK